MITMEASSFSAISLKPRLNFSNYGDLSGIREVSKLPQSYYSCFRMCPNISSPLQKGLNLVLACSLGRGTKIRSFFGHSCFDFQVGMPMLSGQASHSNLLKLCRVKSEDSEGALSGENIILNAQTLEQELQNAIQEENYAQAAKIRDSLRLLQEDSKASVLAANARFYNSFRKGDLAAMQALWSKGENVCVVHPGVSGISGYDLVMGSWEFVWAAYEFPLSIELKDVQVLVRGDLGYVTCVEMVKTKGSSWGRQFATNVFEKIDGQWFICIHHASCVDL